MAEAGGTSHISVSVDAAADIGTGVTCGGAGSGGGAGDAAAGSDGTGAASGSVAAGAVSELVGVTEATGGIYGT